MWKTLVFHREMQTQYLIDGGESAREIEETVKLAGGCLISLASCLKQVSQTLVAACIIIA
jgi:hypothetical protein